MIALATIIGVLLFAQAIRSNAMDGPQAMISGCILLGATMISVQIARLTASIENGNRLTDAGKDHQ